MDRDQFVKSGLETLKYMAGFFEDHKLLPAFPTVKPGYMRELVPTEAPEDGESWEAVFKDIERVVIPGVFNNFSPHQHAYYPIRTSYPSVIGSMLTDTFTNLPGTWEWSPAGTELEVKMMDWLGKMLHLPSKFLTDSGGSGGGVLQSSASEATLMALLSARTRAIRQYQASHPDVEDGVIVSKMVAYCSEEANSSLKKASLIALVKMRGLETDENFSLRGKTLQQAILEDKEKGLIPVFVCATLGTTGPCSFDNLPEIGSICEAEDVWLHVDAAYAGTYFICPEFRPLLNGVEFAKTVVFNPHKAMHVSFECSAMWIDDVSQINNAFQVNPVYMNPDWEHNKGMPEFRNWHIGGTRPCRSLKLWLVLRMFGVKHLQELARKDVAQAKQFVKLVETDSRFAITCKVVLGVVCFRLKADNDVNRELLEAINKDGRIYLGPTMSKGIFYLRLVVRGYNVTPEDILFSWQTVQDVTNKLVAGSPLDAVQPPQPAHTTISNTT